jgi:hypothetical protein
MATLDNIAIPDDLLWSDEFDWTPLEVSVERTLTGVNLIQTGTKTGGRNITLVGGADYGWASRATVDALLAKLTATAAMTLTLPGNRVFSVLWRHTDGPIEARPVIDYNAPDAADFYTLTLRLMTA